MTTASSATRVAAGTVRVGCSGWAYPHWARGVFYPPGLPTSAWLEFYATRFDTVELNASFYRLPTRAAVERWAERTPDGFVFAVKTSRYLTHVRRLRDTAEHLALLLDRIEPLRGTPKLGPLLWQLPPDFARDDKRLAEALADLPDDLEHAIEFRHPSWFDDETLALLRSHNVALVLADRPGIEPIRRDEATADFEYLRFHHGSRGRHGNYSDRELREWAASVERRRGRGDVYAYFNNDWHGYAPRNAALLARFLSAAEQGGAGP